MIRKQVYITEDQDREIKLQHLRQGGYEADVIRDIIDKGLRASQSTTDETAGTALLRLAKLGEKLQVKAPADLSSRIDEYLYDDK